MSCCIWTCICGASYKNPMLSECPDCGQRYIRECDEDLREHLDNEDEPDEPAAADESSTA